MSNIKEPVLTVHAERLPFTFIHSRSGLVLCELGTTLSNGDYDPLAIWTLIMSAELLEGRVAFTIGSKGSTF